MREGVPGMEEDTPGVVITGASELLPQWQLETVLRGART